jgi:Zn-finger protein
MLPLRLPQWLKMRSRRRTVGTCMNCLVVPKDVRERISDIMDCLIKVEQAYGDMKKRTRAQRLDARSPRYIATMSFDNLL